MIRVSVLCNVTTMYKEKKGELRLRKDDRIK